MPESAEVLIERVVPGGDGLARLEGRVVLVPGGLPGDTLRVSLAAAGPRLLRGTMVDLLSPGPVRRVESEVCPRAVDRSCGGCDWPALRLESHRTLKTSLVVDAFRRLGGIPEAELPPFAWRGSARSYRLRNRLHVDSMGQLGFYAAFSNRVSDLLACELVSDALLARLPGIRTALRDAGVQAGELVTLEGRDGSAVLGELRVGGPLLAADAERLAQRLHGPLDGMRILDGAGSEVARLGPTALQIEAGGVSFQVSVSSFFQGNRHLLDAFLEETRSVISAAAAAQGRPFDTAMDLYAGGGFLTRPLLEAVSETLAAEIDPSSSADLEANLRGWRESGASLGRAVVVRGSAESALDARKKPIDLVLADPPRAGLSPFVRKRLLALRPKSLLLVSCDPATLARDLASLRAGYVMKSVTLLDLFPGTHHVETMIHLSAR
ncbi:MAG: TRAM domain-containing protein [Thermoanaerobaculia bacterium]